MPSPTTLLPPKLPVLLLKPLVLLPSVLLNTEFPDLALMVFLVLLTVLLLAVLVLAVLEVLVLQDPALDPALDLVAVLEVNMVPLVLNTVLVLEDSEDVVVLMDSEELETDVSFLKSPQIHSSPVLSET